jgi:hypothetical protein
MSVNSEIMDDSISHQNNYSFGSESGKAIIADLKIDTNALGVEIGSHK